MIGRFLLSAVTAMFLSLSAGAVTTSQGIDITVTHGTPSSSLTTFTFVNNSGNTLPAGSPVSFGQAFRYGDITPGTYPLIRDAATHVALPGQQWDEISTFRENGGNGSWRHAVWAAWLPTALSPGAKFQVEFAATAGAYSESSHQPLSALCTGAAAHDLKLDLTDVRNQNDTVRDSGHAAFRLCDNIANVGRDAPRHLRAGNVYDEYEIRGVPVYTSGHPDPLLYEQCIVDIFTKASDGTSPGDVRWVCHQINAWMNVKAGSSGNAGNPGPAGFANDPQAVSYRPQVLDGSSVVMDWSGLDATIASTSNPVVASAGHCDTAVGNFCVQMPSSVGANTWYMGQAERVSCTGTCLGGLTDGQLTYVYPSGTSGARDVTVNTQYVTFSPTPKSDNVFFTNGSQGTGTTSFSFRVNAYHWEAWQTRDWSGQDNWSPFGTTTRVTRKVYPAFTEAEKLYWKQSGVMVPINTTQAGVFVGLSPAYGQGVNYEPMGRLNVIGFTGPGPRPDLGIVNDFAAQALITGTEQAWDYARLFTLGTSMHGLSVLLNEATGRIPAINNGPPVGPGGNGNGGSYAGLGAPQPGVQLENNPQLQGIADVPHNQPNPAYDIAGGTFNYGTYVSHMPSFNGFTYMVFGDHDFLDLMRWHANRDYAQQRPGPGPELGMGYYRDNNATFTDGHVYHYWGLTIDCCQTRGSAWMNRDITYAATFGSDNDIEKSYFADFIQETTNYYPLWLKAHDGPGTSNFSTAINPPNAVGGADVAVDTFQMAYIASAAYIMRTWLHAPLGDIWAGAFQRYYEGVCGQQLSGALAPFYCIEYGLNPATAVGEPNLLGYPPWGNGLNVGKFFNGIDATEFGTFSSSLRIDPGGVLTQGGFTLTSGDKLKNVTSWWPGSGADPIDQLPGNQWFEIIPPIDNSQLNITGYASYHVRCPVGHPVDATCPTPGAAFTKFTRNGVDISGTTNADGPKLRPQFDPGPNTGFASPNYVQYGGETINGLHILGYKVDHAMAAFTAQGGINYYNPTMPQYFWDSTVVIPGLPTAHNGL